MHLDSRGTYGSRRVHAELTLGHGLGAAGYEQVSLLMRRAGDFAAIVDRTAGKPFNICEIDALHASGLIEIPPPEGLAAQS